MSGENSKLLNENVELKRQMDEFEKQIIILKKEVDDLAKKNSELIGQNGKLTERIETLSEESKENPKNSAIVAIPSAFGQMKISTGNNSDGKMDGKEQNVPNWLIEVLEWIKRTEMAVSALSTSCWVFKEVCWPKLHGNVSRIVPRLTILYQQDETFKISATMRRSQMGSSSYEPQEYSIVPIASTKMPEYIHRFQQLHFCFLDGQIFQFVENILPKLDDIALQFGNPENHLTGRWALENVRIPPIRRLLRMLAPKIFEIGLPHDGFGFRDIDNLFPGLIAGIQSLFIHSRISADDLQFLFNWLNNEIADWMPKIITPFWGILPNNFIERVIEEFENATQPATFLIHWTDPAYPDVTLENTRTGEMLVIFRTQYPDNDDQFLVRHRKGSEIAGWEDIRPYKEITYICLDIDEIGEFETVNSC